MKPQAQDLQTNPIINQVLAYNNEKHTTSSLCQDPRFKTSRYLREIDRREILIRLAYGEKQSALAKEYHVSRAAICNLNKHRHEVLARSLEHPLAKHPKRRQPKEDKTIPFKR
ncbi:hypothetical protein PHYSODRAFT_344412 [Plasmopara halstedii]|uniref:HTH psq-type domain-containing protein n=1 Tax=Plasmopara halstedii TaxID=4781 RepID=A0A0P1AUU5_PLAHL|nr:hypothetical protein PHYSODRAFT_344412 [Plasmopara halstedii]CEG45234.1 hypothetical protein PHYSODRAFT_344412 [Plasmopara halstedii]|eukprot:XP_024581603.1 hypothetical protein PHYSODRAFT_344412 [Plasmopara halstedii]